MESAAGSWSCWSRCRSAASGLQSHDPRPAPAAGFVAAGAGDEPARPGAGRGDRAARRDLISSARRRLSPAHWLNNLSSFAVCPLVGGLIVQALIGNVHDPSNGARPRASRSRCVVFGVFMVDQRAQLRADRARQPRSSKAARCCRRSRELFVPMLPGQIAAGALAAMLAVAYTKLGLAVAARRGARARSIFQYLMVALLRSEDRADQLRSALDPPRLAAARRAHDARRDARAARRIDRAPRRRGRPLRARRWREALGCGESRTGPRPHGRPAARHRQVRAARPHPPRRDALRRGLGR